MLSVRLLGSLECRADGEIVRVAGPRPRLVFALLVLERGRLVTRERLIDAIWPTDPPESAATQVAMYVSALRKVLGDAVIETAAAGYRIATDAADIDIDVAEAERLIAEARTTQRVDAYRKAIALWDGPALDGLISPAIAPMAQRLDELYLTTLEDWSALALDVGAERELLDLLPAAVAEHPLRESLRARLMEALWRSGRRADALALYDQGRRVLADELGLDPGAELTGIHLQILADDHPTPPAPVGAGSSPAVAPRQLPVTVGTFCGRTDEAAKLDRHLTATGRGPERTRGSVLALHGPGGVGKTTLATFWAHQVADQFPDGQLFVDLMGYGPASATTPGQAAASLLRGLGVPNPDIPAEDDDRTDLLRRMLADQAMLLVLDNARDSAQVRPLLPGGRNVVLVTSRSQLRSLATREGAHRVCVAPLPPDDSVALLLSRLDPTPVERTDFRLDALTEIAELCGHLPVALAVAGERTSRSGRTALPELINELRDSHAALDTLTAWEDDPATSVRAVLSWSVDSLDADAGHLFCVLGVHPHPQFDARLAAAIARLPLPATKRLLDRLVEQHLLIQTDAEEYRLHDLVHGYARELSATLPDPVRDEAVTRMRRMYFETLLNSRRTRASWWLPRLDAAPPDGLEPSTFTDHRGAMAWFNRHEDRVGAVLDDARHDDDHLIGYGLAAILAADLTKQGRLREASRALRTAEASATVVGDRTAPVICAAVGGLLAFRCGDSALALERLTAAEQVFRKFDHHRDALHALMCQGLALHDLGRMTESIAVLERVLDEQGQIGRGVSMSLSNLAAVYANAGRVDESLTTADRAIQVARTSSDTENEAIATETQGDAYRLMGELSSARDSYARALELHSRTAPSFVTASVLRSLGLVERALGDDAAARHRWHRALRLIEEFNISDNNEVSRSELRRLLAGLPAESQALIDL